MSPKLSPRTHQLVEKIFDPPDQPEARRLLVEECGHNLPFCEKEDEYRLERIRFAALRTSRGSLADLQAVILDAQQDWRNVLVEAGFGESLTAHLVWAKQMLQ